MLRAMRRANESGKPIAASNGRVVIAWAPPSAAEKVAMVLRSMFTHGSRRVSIAGEVTACCCWARADSSTPQARVTRSHSCRAARSLAMVRNWSAVAA